MAGLNVSARNAAVDGLAAVTSHVGLLDASGVELTGGSPAYARKAVTWAAAAAGIRDNTAALLFDVPASTPGDPRSRWKSPALVSANIGLRWTEWASWPEAAA